MTDWSKPSLTDPYASVLSELMARDTSAATMTYSADSNIPNGTIRWNPATYTFESYSSSGGNWAAWTTQLNIKTVLLGQNSLANTMQAVPRSQADALYQPAGSYAALGGIGSQAFLVGNSTAATQQAVPRAQADTLYQPAGSYAVLAGSGSQAFLVGNSTAATQQAVPRAQADQLYQAAGSYAALNGNASEVFSAAAAMAGSNQVLPSTQLEALIAPLMISGNVTTIAGSAAAPGNIWLTNVLRGMARIAGYFADSPLGGNIATYGLLETKATDANNAPNNGGSSWFFQRLTLSGGTSWVRYNINAAGWSAWDQEITASLNSAVRFTSAGQTIGQNSIISVVHNLGGLPRAFGAYLVCAGAELGYGVNDAAGFDLDDAGAHHGSNPVRANSSNLYLATGDSIFRVIQQVAASNADWTAITPANWRLVMWATI